jgi:protease-4
MTGGDDSRDLLAALRRLRRSLATWRVLAVLALVAALAAVFWQQASPITGEHVARVRVSGLITGSQRQLDLLEKIAEDKKARALIVRIDSPGGTVTGAEALYQALRRVAEKKPVVAVVDSVAASGGYIAALGADRIFTRRNSITGSIGVIFQWAELHELLNRFGIRVQALRSGPYKARPNPFEPMDPQVKKATEALLRDSFDWFVALVASRRGLDRQTARRLADGRVWTGHQARALGLVDEIGDEKAARAWLEKEKGISARIRIVERRPRRLTEELGLGLRMMVAALRGLGLNEAAEALLAPVRRAQLEGLTLDGLMVLWHPRLVQEARGLK